MIRVLFVGDGERDAVSVPRLVEGLLKVTVYEETRKWARLHGSGKGYAHKLLYALRQAQDAGVSALVATVDADNDKKGQRLRRMKKARETDRERSPAFPTALGRAIPHGEAWLLDDTVAVRQALQLSPEVNIPTVRQTKNPKDTLHHLLGKSPRAAERPRDVWGDIARDLDVKRCSHSKKTGFHAFAQEVQEELGALTDRAQTKA